MVMTLGDNPEVWDTETGGRRELLEVFPGGFKLQGVYVRLGERASGANLGGDGPLNLLYELWWPHNERSSGLYYDAPRDTVVNAAGECVSMPLSEILVSVYVWCDDSTVARQMTLQEFRSALSRLWVRACLQLPACLLACLPACLLAYLHGLPDGLISEVGLLCRVCDADAV